MAIIMDWFRQVVESKKIAPVEFGVMADELVVTEEDENTLQAAYLQAKMDVALKEISRLESEKGVLRMQIEYQRRFGDKAIRQSRTVLDRAAKLMSYRMLRFLRERTFLGWCVVLFSSKVPIAASLDQIQQRKLQEMQKAANPAGAASTISGLWVRVGNDPLQLVNHRNPPAKISGHDAL